MATAKEVQAVLNNPNFFQRFRLRREARNVINDKQMERRLLDPLYNEALAFGATATEAHAQELLDGNYDTAAKAVARGLSANQGFAASDVGASPFIDLIVQLFQQLMPLLLQCLKPLVP